MIDFYSKEGENGYLFDASLSDFAEKIQLVRKIDRSRIRAINTLQGEHAIFFVLPFSSYLKESVINTSNYFKNNNENQFWIRSRFPVGSMFCSEWRVFTKDWLLLAKCEH